MEKGISLDLSRRSFLKISAFSILSLSLNTLSLSNAQEPKTEYPYRQWEELYKNKWKWDRVVKGTHAQTNCRAHCAWDLYVKEGIIWREEQNCTYPDPENPDLVDFNPGGCQKGAMFSQVVYAPYRIKYPLKRVGQRGEGKWKRISWDEALTEIAEKVIEAIKEHGPDAITQDVGGTNGSIGGPSGISRMRFFDFIGTPVMDGWTEMVDLNWGAILTYGQSHVDGTMDDCLNSEFIMIWTMNPNYALIPYMHFIHEAMYNGAKVVCVAPDYSPSSIHTDLWVPLRPGTDSALGLGMANVIVQERLFNEAHIKEQTDLPFLIREDNKRFLRESDLKEGGSQEVFYIWNLMSNMPQKAPGCKGSSEKTISLGNLDPALEGTWEIDLIDGKKVRITTAFELLKDRLKEYTPDVVHKITGGPGLELIRNLARDLAKAKSAMIFASWGSNKNYHSDLHNRTKCLLLALCGHIGKAGCGFRSSTLWIPDESWRLGFPSLVKGKAPIGSNALFYKYHMGTSIGKDEWSDKEHMKRTMEEYIDDSVKKGWIKILPQKTPKIWIGSFGNFLRRAKSYHVAQEHLWPKLDMVVTIDFRPNNTVLHSDIVLPAATQYEKTDMKYALNYCPYFAFQEKAVEPLYESKDEWEIFALLAQKIQEKAKEKGFTKYWDPNLQITRDLGTLYDDFTLNGKFGPKVDADQFMQHIFDNSEVTKGLKVEDLKRDGIAKVKNSGPWCYPSGMPFVGPFFPFGLTSPLKQGEALTPFLYYTEEKKSWPTLTGRQQFYIDHEWFLEFKEELPIHKEPPKIGGDYPFIISGGHTRWSIHNIWRDHAYMLRLQRGAPVMYMNDEDAQRLGIKDHDLVRVSNDVGNFMIHVKPSPAVRPAMVIVYHAWDPKQHVEGRNQQVVFPGGMKALHLVGDYGQLFIYWAHWAPAPTVRETRVKVEKI